MACQQIVFSVMVSALGALTAIAVEIDAPGDERPNVVLICADDLNADLGCYGHMQVRSPWIDRLAQRSVRFDRAYCQYPVCNPSRTSFLSGLRPTTTGVLDNQTPPRSRLPDAVFLPEHFRRHGYRTLKIGKVFHTGEAFEDPRSWDVDIRELRTAKNPRPEQIVGRRGKDGIVLECEDSETWDGFIARGATELSDDARSVDKPFFLAVGFRRPHAPYIAPRRYHEIYPSESIAALLEPAEHVTGIPSVALAYAQGGARLTPEARPDVVGSYFASVTFMDAQLGLLLSALDECQLWNNTVVVFLGDHGYHLGEHGGLWHKGTLFEAACRVPLLIAAPGIKSGVAKQVVELLDLYPTLCEICHLSPPAGLEGRSLAPQIRDPSRTDDRPAFTVVTRSADRGGPLDAQRLGRSIRTARWRYTEWFDGSRELYDYDTDPLEYQNLALRPELVKTVDRHRELMSALATRASDN